MVLKKSMRLPVYPERVCWGCDRYCPANALACGMDTLRTPHPVELFGEDWEQWAIEHHAGPTSKQQAEAEPRAEAPGGNVEAAVVLEPELEPA